MSISHLRRVLRRPIAVAVLAGVAAAVALGALNHAAHPGAAWARLLWAAGGVLSAVAAVVLAGRKESTVS